MDFYGREIICVFSLDDLRSLVNNEEIANEEKFNIHKIREQRGLILVNKNVYNYVCICLKCFEVLFKKEKF